MPELITCPHCGTPTSPSSKLCHRCGGEIPDYLRGGALKCPNCLKITSAVEERCRHCGNSIPEYLLAHNREEVAKTAKRARAEAEKASPSAQPQSTSQQTEAPGTEKQPEPTLRKVRMTSPVACPNCDQLTSRSKDTCEHCGFLLPPHLLTETHTEEAPVYVKPARQEMRERQAAKAPPTEKPQPAPEQTVKGPPKPSAPQPRMVPPSAPLSYHYRSSYKVARIVAKILSGVGWVLLVVGVIATVGVIVAQLQARGPALLMLSFALGFPAGVAVTGLLMVAIGQITRASVDIADYSGEMLAILKAQNVYRGQQR